MDLTWKYYLHLYKVMFFLDLKSKMTYPLDFIISVAGVVLTNMAGFAVLKILFFNFTEIDGWGYYKILFLYSFSMLSAIPAQCFLENNWNLGDQVLTGDFVKYCIKPVNLFFCYHSEIFDIKGIGQLVVGASALGYAWCRLQIPFTFGYLLLLIFTLLTASLFMMALMNLAAAVNFRSVLGAEYMMTLVFKFSGYARYPITIFHTVLKKIFTFVIPIAFMAYYPSLFFLEPEHLSLTVYFAPVWGMVLFYISYKIWMKGALSYAGTGS
ncbi:MAG: ABC-2 family transporter protein [Hungatella sp.]|jgi:ABC-2 type transport system permease protein|nr:ABC-2 family transporter protein [Hungatella sp.]